MSWLPSVIWLALLILFAAAEAATVGLVSIWFAAGALAALLSTFFISNIWAQIAIFLAVSILTMALVRPLVNRYVTPRHIPTNADRVIGREAVVTEEIDNLTGRGAVRVAGIVWTARSLTDGPAIPAGTTVTVRQIEGVKLLVSLPETGKE